MEASLLDHPLVQLAIAGVIGFMISEWRAGRGAHAKALQVDTDLLARLKTVERWQEDHNSIHGCVRELAATVKAMAANMNRLTNRLDYWMQRMPAPPPARSPFDFQSAREWIDPEPQEEWRT